MSSPVSRRPTLSGLLILGILLAMLLVGCSGQQPSTASSPNVPTAGEVDRESHSTGAPTAASVTEATEPPPTDTPTPSPLWVALAPDLPVSIAEQVRTVLEQASTVEYEGIQRPLGIAGPDTQAAARVSVVPLASIDETTNTEPPTQFTLAQRFYAVVVPFETVNDDIDMAEFQARWAGEGEAPMFLTEATAQELAPVLGECAGSLIADVEEIESALLANEGAIGVLPFQQLDPRFKVLTLGDLNILSNQLDPETYPLAIAINLAGPKAASVAPLLLDQISPANNRDPQHLTTLVMTGVTAMTRATAARMEAMGYTYPAEVIAPEVSQADIVHVSNEVPFVEGCVVNTTENNLVMCSDYPYWAALEAIGTDIVGLSGNHVNDYGRDGARESIQFYRDRDIAIYGSGLNEEEACAPLMWEHNGNTFAFLATLAFAPEYAWATETEPGACYYYYNRDEILAKIAELREQVDIVAVELQYEETYNPFPTFGQVIEFREVRDAGAHIVTGVQSHVPQAMEPYGASDPNGPGAIVYGLGNLFFDQMWSWETRTGLIVRHTIYEGRLISSEILTTVLEDYAQPRWATPGERREILERIFTAAPERP